MASSSRTLFENLRRDPNLRIPLVKEALPSYFQEEYPNLVLFLEKYYDACICGMYGTPALRSLDQDLSALRDLDEINLSYIDRLFYEIGNGASSDYFRDPRLIGKLLSLLIQNKGNEYSTQLFFRIFFGESPEISYPKDRLFIVAESPLNDQLYLIQDGARYQVLSVLIKSGLPISRWESLYRSFIHTAGYFLSADVILQDDIVDLNLGLMPLSIEDTNVGTITVEDIAIRLDAAPLAEIYLHTTDSADGDAIYVSATDNTDKYNQITIGNLNKQYDDTREFEQATSHLFSEDSDGTLKSPTFSNTLERFDEDLVDSSFSYTLLYTWILADGTWNDDNQWNNGRVWIDSA